MRPNKTETTRTVLAGTAAAIARHGRALAVLAPFVIAAACSGNDDGDYGDERRVDGGGPRRHDAGPEQNDRGRTDDGGRLTATECVDVVGAAAANAGVASAECVECLCEADPQTTVACTSDCWNLNACLVTNCRLDPMFESCAVRMCGEYVGAQAKTLAVGMGPYQSCSDLCPPGSLDAGADAGR